MAGFTNEVLDQLYAIQDTFVCRPVRVKPYGKTYGVSYTLRCYIYGVECSVSEYQRKKEIAFSSSILLLEKEELRKEKKKRKNNRKKTLRDHRR